MLFDVAPPEHEHAEQIQHDANSGVTVVLRDLVALALCAQMPQERNGIEHGEEAEHAVGQHETEKIVTNVGRR